ncbi:Glycerophosphoryl diester phosphodiesterase [Chromobacterium violaceum]|uniref:Glycerophosphoryl diester phosphodiesterase n=1 Tax=Chromobacterium violaceum TaxID=536 RepID=A0A447TIX5_CHRVL|nr:Glycerophosphoryl diester phosphodiesterase [Chromobacterium violaceum]
MAGAAVPPLLSSFEIDALRAAQAAEPALPRAFLCEEIPADWRAILAELDCVALHCDHKSLTEPLARDIKAAGYQLLCYTVNDPADARRLLAWAWTACAPTGWTCCRRAASAHCDQRWNIGCSAPLCCSRFSAASNCRARGSPLAKAT